MWLVAVLPAEAHEHVVEGFAPVVRVDPAGREPKRAPQLAQCVGHRACLAREKRDAFRFILYPLAIAVSTGVRTKLPDGAHTRVQAPARAY